MSMWWINYVNAFTFAVLGATFWIQARTAEMQGRSGRGTRIGAIVMWVVSALLLALAIFTTVVVALDRGE